MPNKKKINAEKLIRDSLESDALVILDQLGRYGDQPDRSIHEARRRLKRLRAALALCRRRSPYIWRVENPPLREVARSLGRLRDHAAALEALDDLEAEISGLNGAALIAIRQSLELGGLASPGAATDDVRVVGEGIAAVARFLSRVPDMPLQELSRTDLKRSAKRMIRSCRRRYAAADESRRPADFHDWRKAVRRAFFATEILWRALPGWSRQWRGPLHDIGHTLGRGHDQGTLHLALSRLPDEVASDIETQRIARTARLLESELYDQARMSARKYFG